MQSFILALTCIAIGLAVMTSSPRAVAGETAHLNLAEFGRLMAWKSLDDTPVELRAINGVPDGARGLGVIWDDPRDVQQIRIRFKDGTPPDDLRVEYWFSTWPPEPPRMPVMEDGIDDPWRGKWLTARTDRATRDGSCVLTFKPLAEDENDRADHLPGVRYRRTLKVRLIVPKNASDIESMEVFSASTLKPLSVRIELGCGGKVPPAWSAQLNVFNGKILSVADVKDNLLTADLLVSQPAPAGSNDMTVVTVRASASVKGRAVTRTFSFNTLDLERGSIYVPDMQAYITRADDPKRFNPNNYKSGKKIRDRILTEPEQTYERASSEIPEQNPWVRQYGDMVYLPLSADASWQKFCVQYDGHIWISKGGPKAKGAERKRLKWAGENLNFRIGTGEKPYYREDHKASMAVADEFLPITLNRWESDGLQYEQEAFATLLEGPLDPNDPDRSEQTPGILMVRLRATNPSNESRRAHFRFDIGPDETLRIEGQRLYSTASKEGAYEQPPLRAVVVSPNEETLALADGLAACQYDVPSGRSADVLIKIPFVSDIAGGDVAKMESLDYDEQRERVAVYWRAVIERTCRFSVPEPKFNYLARFVVPHVHISTNKCPKSGLYMVPAASMWYQVYANEACFQAMMLDALGDTARAGQYLQTFVELQGSRSFPGTYEEPHDGVYHGAKVNDEYDYTASSYNLDHGTVLWSLARHYFFTRDKAWLEGVLPSMFKAVEWIGRQRRLTMKSDVHGDELPEWGMLPAGHLEDNDDWGFWFSINAYCVAGMIQMSEALVDIDHPKANEITDQAERYREDLRAAIMRTVEAAPVVRMRDGTYSPYVPPRARQRFRQFGPLQGRVYSRYGKGGDILPCFRLSGTREVLYGPMILLDLEILDPDDVMAEWILDDWEDNLTLSGTEEPFNVHGFTDEKLWFSHGGMVWQSNLQNPILAYLKRNETKAAIRNIYNNFVACLYKDINTLTEEYRMWGRGSGPFYKSPDESRFVNRLRDMLVLESNDDLRLASGAPRRWLASKEGIRVDAINSYFGQVSYTLRAGDEPNTVVAHVVPPNRPKPKNLWLYVRLPNKAEIAGVQINGQAWDDIDRNKERIRLPLDGTMDMVIRY